MWEQLTWRSRVSRSPRGSKIENLNVSILNQIPMHTSFSYRSPEQTSNFYFPFSNLQWQQWISTEIYWICSCEHSSATSIVYDNHPGLQLLTLIKCLRRICQRKNWSFSMKKVYLLGSSLCYCLHCSCTLEWLCTTPFLRKAWWRKDSYPVWSKDCLSQRDKGFGCVLHSDILL